MIRLLCIAIFLFFFFLISIPLFLIEWLLGKINMNARHRSSRAIVAFAFKVCMLLAGVRVEVTGKENIPEGACLFVANHNGIFDVLVSYVATKKVMGFISKKEIKKVPLLNIWMYYVNCLFIDRENIRQGLKTILEAAEYIKKGISILVFPEGTRSKDGKMAPFKEGSMKIAEKSNGIIVPVAITGTAQILEKSFPRIKSGVVTIDYGTPINANEMTKEDRKFLGAYTQQKIQDMLDKRMAS